MASLIKPFNQPPDILIAILQDYQKARNINAQYEKKTFSETNQSCTEATSPTYLT